MEKKFDRKEYNRMCTELLGYVNKTLDDKDFNIHEHPITKHMIETNFTNVFTEDWNWIMKVIEKMEELSSNTIFNITLKGDFTISRTIVEFYFNPSNNSLLHLKLTSNPMDDYKHPMYKHHIVQDFDFKNKGRKAAVVQAIWLFLNWYNENK
jgi:hypothetical protein